MVDVVTDLLSVRTVVVSSTRYVHYTWNRYGQMSSSVQLVVLSTTSNARRTNTLLNVGVELGRLVLFLTSE
jgi:hypothetical protein